MTVPSVPGPGRDEQVYRITAAKTSLSDDQRSRARKYLISMGIRTACFLGAIVASGAVRWVLVVAAVLLPYVAVVVANAGREPDRDRPPTTVHRPTRRALEPGESDSHPLG